MNSNCSNLLNLIILQEQVKKHSVTKNCSDLSLCEQIVLVISKPLQSFSRSLEQFFLTVGQNNFGNKIPLQNFYHFYKTFDHADEKLFLRITLTIVKVSSFLRWAILIVFNDARTTKLCRLDYFFNLDIFSVKNLRKNKARGQNKTKKAFSPIRAIRVVEFSNGGYKIRKVFA